MNKKQKILLVLLLSLLIMPVVAFAQSDQPDIGDTQDTGFICPQGDSLLGCIPRLYNFALGIAGLIAMGVLVGAGYLYMTAGGNGEQLDKAKKMIGGAFAGIILLVTAYILLEFLDPRLVSLDSPTPLSTSTGAGPGGTPGTGGPSTGTMTDSSARSMLASANICNYPSGWSISDCVNAPEPQTSLNGIMTATIQEVIALKQGCDNWYAQTRPGIKCTVVVTGGTETTGGHQPGACSHLSGHKIDVDDNPNLDHYIRVNFTRSGSRGNHPRYINPSTNAEYVLEFSPSHWDIAVGCS